MLVPFASLLTFPAQGGNALSAVDGDGNAIQPLRDLTKSKQKRTMTPILPPTSHLVCTTNFPAPSTFIPWHYARQTLQSGGYVVWIGCTAAGESHVRLTLRRVKSTAATNIDAQDDPSGSQSTPSKVSSARLQERLIYLDALDTLCDIKSFKNGSGTTANQVDDQLEDARLVLLRLQHRLEQALTRLTTSDEEEQAHLPPALVVLDDAAVLAWTVEAMTDPSAATDLPTEDERKDSKVQDEKEEDPRIKLLREKRKEGATAIHRDEIGSRVGTFIVEHLHKETCVTYGASLLTHITADNTSITAPEARTQATRGGTYGVGTGFDADDAGEEDEAEELYEEHSEQWQANGEADDEDSIAVQAGSRTGTSTGVASASVDWRVDSLLRRTLLSADVWIEIRGLRSGRARDCHGEICTYSLQRPCRALNIPLPNLPMPADPLGALRNQDRSAKPLKQFSRLSLAGANDPAKHADQQQSSGSAATPLLTAFQLESRCQSREGAMLFRIEPNGDAVAWNRGGTRV